jgi:DNA (cytosine-5)-methyltransferase 1
MDARLSGQVGGVLLWFDTEDVGEDMTDDLTHIDLFSGIGGFALAAGWAGFRTIAFCEIEPFCQEVLKARFGAVADTSGANGQGNESEQAQVQFGGGDIRPLLIPDIFTFDSSRFRGATLLTGGFPCQPFSCAGKRRGKEDDRHLWPEMLRVISEARPTWVVGENVAGIVNMELEQVCLDLEGEDYEVQPVVIPACAVNAPHRRDRVWIIGYSSSPRGRGAARRLLEGKNTITNGINSNAPDTESQRWDRPQQDMGMRTDIIAQYIGGEGETTGWDGSSFQRWEENWPEVATRLCRVDDGLSRRVDRLKALGNSIVPQVAYQIIKAIAEIERQP